MEFINGGELYFHLKSGPIFTEDRARFYISEIFLAIEHLHSKGIIYRDLKPENVLLDLQGHVKLTDFGLSKVGVDRTHTICGTPEYIAPEIIMRYGYGKAIDYWSLGALLYEMVSGAPPFYSENRELMYKMKTTRMPEIPAHLSAQAKDLLKSLL